MGFYELDKEQRQKLAEKIEQEIFSDIKAGERKHILLYFSDEDTYIRKAAYSAVGKIYNEHTSSLSKIVQLLKQLFELTDEKVRQTAINAAGEIGIKNFSSIENLMEKGLYDEHHSVRNAVIGSIKKMGEKNPEHVLAFAKRFLHHEDKEIRREICHGLELYGRTHPQDILPLLKELQNEKTARVRNTLTHVLGQISYKKDCLPKVIEHLKTWKNKKIVSEALDEIIDVHGRYRNFAELTQEEAIKYIEKNT